MSEERLAKPLGDRVLLTELEAEASTTPGGIIIPDSVKQEDVKRAKVESIGPGIYTQNGVLIPMNVKVGDEVILPPYHQGQEIKVGGNKYLLLRESEILMVIQ
jgi:chaperonin GroES